MLYLAGDIGGTKTHLVLVKKEKTSSTKELVQERTFPSQSFPSLLALLEQFLFGVKRPITCACFGVAGPVKQGQCQTTNLPWSISAKEVEKKFSINKTLLLNDLEANAYGLLTLPKKDFVTLNPGKAQKGNAALISAGTGLGEAGLYFDGTCFHPFASEGGHTDFAPTSELEIELFLHLRKKFGHVSYERILSGPGLHSIYQFFIEEKKEKDDEEYKQKIATGDGPRVIFEKAISGQSAVCAKSVELFTAIYGAEAGNLALKMLATGGLYIGGGIAPKILPFLKKGPFLQAFKAKGRFSQWIEHVPIHLIVNQDAALLGAISCALAGK